MGRARGLGGLCALFRFLLSMARTRIVEISHTMKSWMQPW